MNIQLQTIRRQCLVALLCLSYMGVTAQFSGFYDPTNWSTVQISGANGSVNPANAPTSIALTGPDNISGQAWTRYQITIPATGTLSFSWSVVHQDPGYDGFGYWYNNTYTELTDQTQSGTTSISVAAGQLFAFYGESFDGCCGTFVSTISNFVAPNPAMNDAGIDEIINPSDDFCADSTEVLVRIKNFGINQITPVSVGWSVNGVNQSPVTYTGLLDTAGGTGVDTAVVSLGNFYFEDTISLLVWTSMPNNVADTSNLNDTMLIEFVAANPEISLDNQDMCEGDFFTLSAEAGFAAYLWSTGSTAQQIQITQGGSYAVTVTDIVGCQDSAIAFITEHPSPDVSLGPDTSACDGLVLDAGNAGNSYNWSSGEFTQSILVTSSGFYSVTVESSQGCEGEDEIQVTIHESPTVDLGSNFSLCVEEGETAVLAAGSQFQFYSWSTGETTSNIIVGGYNIPVGSQNFSVQVTDANGCSGADTVKVNFISCWPTGLDDPESAGKLVAYPNPTHGMLTLSVGASGTHITRASIVDMQGSVVEELSTLQKTSLTIDLSHLASSLYLLQVVDSEGNMEVLRLAID